MQIIYILTLVLMYPTGDEMSLRYRGVGSNFTCQRILMQFAPLRDFGVKFLKATCTIQREV